MTPLGVRRNFLIILDDDSLKSTLDFLHSFYIWDSTAVFLVVVVGSLDNQERIIIEKGQSSTPYAHVLVMELNSSNFSLQSSVKVGVMS